MKEAVLVIMAKEPRVGYTKTRLCPPLTQDEAAGLSDAMLRDTIALVADLPATDLAVAVTPAEAHPYFEEITPPGTHLLAVEGLDIGLCLQQALETLLGLGYSKVLALNADGPSLPVAYIQQAVIQLAAQDVVLGPNDDGGYYLIGLKKPAPGLFSGISWSTPQVLAQTLLQAGELGLQVGLLPAWFDVDTAEDLQRLVADLDQLSPEHLVFTRTFLSASDIPQRLA